MYSNNPFAALDPMTLSYLSQMANPSPPQPQGGTQPHQMAQGFGSGGDNGYDPQSVLAWILSMIHQPTAAPSGGGGSKFSFNFNDNRSQDDIYREMFPQGYYHDLFGVHGIGDPGGGDLPSWPADTGGQGGPPDPTGPGPGVIDWRSLKGGG